MAPLPDFSETPFGNLLLDAPAEPEVASVVVVPQPLTQVVVRPSGLPKLALAKELPPSGIAEQATLAAPLKLSTAASLRAIKATERVAFGNRTPAPKLDAPPRPPRETLPADSVASATLGNADAPTIETKDYVIQPPLDQLQQFSSDGLSHVNGFSISRADGKCTVAFLEPINLIKCPVDRRILLPESGHVELRGDPFSHSHCRVTVRGVRVDERALRTYCMENNLRHLAYDRRSSCWTYECNSKEAVVQVSSSDNSSEDAGEVDASPLPTSEMISPEGRWTPAATTFEAQQQTPAHAVPPSYLVAPMPATAQMPTAAEQAAADHYKLTFNPIPLARPSTRVEDLPFAEFRFEKPSVRPVLLIRREDSSLSRCVIVAKQANTAPAEVVMGRAFRIGWGPRWIIAAPEFAAVADVATAKVFPAETDGARVKIVRAVPLWPDRQQKLLSQVIDGLKERVVSSGNPPASLKLRAPYTALCLALADVLSSEGVQDSRLWQHSLKQASSVIRLFAALFGTLPDDTPFSTPQEEARYNGQMRRKNLSEWLDAEVKNASVKIDNSVRGRVLQLLLQHKVQEAREECVRANERELQRFVSACGTGNVVGHTLRGFSDPGSPLLSLLIGEIQPFVSTPCFSLVDSEIVRARAALSWKQLLGVFLFYASPPSEDIRQVILRCRERLYQEGTRNEGALPGYSAGASATERGRDVLARARAHEDAALGLLTAFATNSSPSPVVLHPHSSSYFAHDYSTPFLLSCLLRTTPLQLSAAYQLAERDCIVGFAAQLEQHGDYERSALVLQFLPLEDERHAALYGLDKRNPLKHPPIERIGAAPPRNDRLPLSSMNYLHSSLQTFCDSHA